MAELNQTKKTIAVLLFLFKNRDRKFLLYSIVDAFKNKISEIDIERIIEEYVDKGTIISSYATDVDGNNLGVELYTLSNPAIILFEKELKSIDNESNINLKEEGNYIVTDKEKSQYWFIVGKYFVNGEINELYKRFDGNFNQIAIHLGNRNLRDYINHSYNDIKNSNKNIFNSQIKLKKLKRYFQSEGSQIHPDFTKRINI